MSALPPHVISIPSQMGLGIQHSALYFGAYLSGHEEYSLNMQGRQSLWGNPQLIGSKNHCLSGGQFWVAFCQLFKVISVELPSSQCSQQTTPPLLTHAQLPHSYFLGSPPKQTTCIQFLISGSAFKATQIKAFHSLALGDFQKYKLELLQMGGP